MFYIVATGLLLAPSLALLVVTFFPRKLYSVRGSCCAITGASEGLGVTIAQQLAQEGVRKLVLGARRMEKLQAVKETLLTSFPALEVILVKLDVRDAESRRHFTRLSRESGCTILVNNAGVERSAFFEKMPESDIDLMLETNLTSCVKLSRDFSQIFLEASGGHIVNIASVAGQAPVPFGAVYAATKAALRNLTLSLRCEMVYEKKPVTFHSICPGLVVDAGLAVEKEERLGTTIRRAAFLAGWTTPLRVAQAVVSSIEYDEPDIVVNSLPARLVCAAQLIFPRLLECILPYWKGPFHFFREDAKFEASKS